MREAATEVRQAAERLRVPEVVNRAINAVRLEDINRGRLLNRDHRITRFPAITTERKRTPIDLDWPCRGYGC